MSHAQQVMFIQGAGEGAHDEWDIRLVESLRRELGDEYDIRYPRMPQEDDPRYDRWNAAIRRELTELDDGAVAIGHSVGATVLAGTLAERPPRPSLASLVLIAAPFVGAGGWPSDEIEFSDDLGARLPDGMDVQLFHGTEDDTVPTAHLDLYANAIPQARAHRLVGRDHQLGDDLREVAAAVAEVTGFR